MSKKKRMRGSVQKVIKPIVPDEPEKAQIGIEEADGLNRELRLENLVTDENGVKARLKAGADVDVVIEADSNATTKKPDRLFLISGLNYTFPSQCLVTTV